MRPKLEPELLRLVSNHLNRDLSIEQLKEKKPTIENRTQQ